MDNKDYSIVGIYELFTKVLDLSGTTLSRYRKKISIEDELVFLGYDIYNSISKDIKYIMIPTIDTSKYINEIYDHLKFKYKYANNKQTVDFDFIDVNKTDGIDNIDLDLLSWY